MAFFPCIYFCESSQCAFRLWHFNYRNLSEFERIQKIVEREQNRTKFYTLLIKLVGVCISKGLRLVIENPWSGIGYLRNNFLKDPTIIDHDRTLRGDYYKKPTAYWFFNCENTKLTTFQRPKEIKTIRKTKGSTNAGICSEERSMISTDYARNFICDFLIGKEQTHTQLTLF